jgi:hypothetical protein
MSSDKDSVIKQIVIGVSIIVIAAIIVAWLGINDKKSPETSSPSYNHLPNHSTNETNPNKTLPPSIQKCPFGNNHIDCFMKCTDIQPYMVEECLDMCKHCP